jgi:predicted amidohydrolase
MTRIAVQQLEPVVGELEHNRALALAAIREAVAAGAEVVVLPELITSGYVFHDRDEAAAVAIEPDVLREWAADAIVIGGFCERGEDGHLHNSAALVEDGEVRAVYRKLHLWDREKLVFEPGSKPPPVVDTRAGRIGVMICYDLEFPELTRWVALQGAQLLAVPTTWPLVPRPEGERPPEVQIAMAAARVNRMAIACADRLGTERGVEWTGGATIVGVDGWVAAERRDPGRLDADVDLREALEKRLTDNADAHGDRRPDIYALLAEASEAARGGGAVGR